MHGIKGLALKDVVDEFRDRRGRDAFPATKETLETRSRVSLREGDV